MATLQELLAQREALERQIHEVSTKERTEAIEKIRSLMADNGVTMADLGNRAGRGANGSDVKAPKKAPGSKVAAKFRNSDSGETWSGRGLKPKWLTAAIAAGKKIEDFAV